MTLPSFQQWSRVDCSGPLRGRYAPPPKPPQCPENPALCLLTYHLDRRPYWELHTPFAVPPELYDAGRIEMAANMKRRGFSVPRDGEIEQEHFLLFATPIMAKDE